MAKPKPVRKKHLRNADLALDIKIHGFDKVRAELGDRLDPIRAAKIVKLLVERHKCPENEINKDLLELASQKRQGHMGGPVKPPTDGEERPYLVGANNRIGVSVSILGRRSGQKVRVRYGRERIVITK